MYNFVNAKLVNVQLNRLKDIIKTTKACPDCLIAMF